MSPRFVLGRENVPCVTDVANWSLKADCTDFTGVSFQKSLIFLKMTKSDFFVCFHCVRFTHNFFFDFELMYCLPAFHC